MNNEDSLKEFETLELKPCKYCQSKAVFTWALSNTYIAKRPFRGFKEGQVIHQFRAAVTCTDCGFSLGTGLSLKEDVLSSTIGYWNHVCYGFLERNLDRSYADFKDKGNFYDVQAFSLIYNLRKGLNVDPNVKTSDLIQSLVGKK